MNESESSSPESPAKEQPGEQERAALVKRLVGARDAWPNEPEHIPLLLSQALSLIEKLGQGWIPLETLPADGTELTYAKSIYTLDSNGKIWKLHLPPPPERP